MTSDAKIGLLLGLVFIFIIAFVINGLPSFHKDANNNELTVSMADSQNEPPGIAAKERKVSREVINQGIRSIRPLPNITSVAKEAEKAVEVELTTGAAPPRPIITKESGVEKAKSAKPTLPKVYVVEDGDNLAVIAKKFYGSEQGSKRTNIARIFDANRRFLESPDEIYVGQKLDIPPLSALVLDKSKVSSVLASPMLEKVKSIGKRHLSADWHRRWYVVQEGDSLWRIAAEQLGSGSRYSEIAGLNADILDDEDSLAVGMRLKMPVR